MPVRDRWNKDRMEEKKKFSSLVVKLRSYAPDESPCLCIRMHVNRDVCIEITCATLSPVLKGEVKEGFTGNSQTYAVRRIYTHTKGMCIYIQ